MELVCGGATFFLAVRKFSVNDLLEGLQVLVSQYRPQNTVGMRLLDDAPVVAQVLHEGMPLFSARVPAKHFWSQLGFSGSCYRDAIVLDLKSENRPELANGPETLAISCVVQHGLYPLRCEQEKTWYLREVL